MVILRPTRKLRQWLPTASVPDRSDTALGDWYVNRIVIERQPLLLLISSTSLLPIVLSARDVRSLPNQLAVIVTSRLRRLGLHPGVIELEAQAMRPVVIAPTADRSVIGIMVDFAKAASYYSGDFRIEQDRIGLEDWLAAIPCHAGLAADRVIFPNQKAPDLLRARWLVNEPLQPSTASKIVGH